MSADRDGGGVRFRGPCVYSDSVGNFCVERVPAEGPEAPSSTEAVTGVHLSMLASGESTNVQHFTIEPGETVPKHSHPHEQAGFVYAGELVFAVDGEDISVSEGGSYVIPGEEAHSAVNRGDVPVRGVDVFSPPRTDPDWADD